MKIQFSDQISEDSPEVRLLSLVTLNKKVGHALFEIYMNESIKCYNTKKAVEESNDIYTKKVSNCFSEVRKYQKSSVKDFIKSMQTLRNLEIECDKRKLHCSNLISEAEINLCCENEFSKFVDDYGNHMRNFIHLYESKYSKFKKEF